MNVLAIDIGGTQMKILAMGQNERWEFESGPKLTPKLMVAGVKKLARDWSYDVTTWCLWVIQGAGPTKLTDR